MKEENIPKPLKKMIPLELIKIDKRVQHIKTPFTTQYNNTNGSSLSYRVNIHSHGVTKCTSEGRRVTDEVRKASYGIENIARQNCKDKNDILINYLEKKMIQTQKNFEEIMMKTNNHFANNITAFKFPKIKNEHNSTRKTKFASASHKKIPFVNKQSHFPLPPDNLYSSNRLPINMQNNYKYNHTSPRTILNNDTFDLEEFPSPKNEVCYNQLSDYTFLEEVGKGAYAIVKKAFHKPTNSSFAIKVYEKIKLVDPQKRTSVKKEIQILKKLNHKNIVKLIDIIYTTNQIFLIMELIEGVSLLSYLRSKDNRRLNEYESRRIYEQILKAIQYCHSRNIYHRDIKLENIIICDNQVVKIIDFGFATFSPKNKLMNFFCGTPSYMAPEICFKRDYLGPGVDIWSSGILLYALICGHFPFQGKNEKELFMKINEGILNFPEFVSVEIRSFLRNILTVNPYDRPSADQILNSSWMQF